MQQIWISDMSIGPLGIQKIKIQVAIMALVITALKGIVVDSRIALNFPTGHQSIYDPILQHLLKSL